jgi:hypothetical protein
MYKHTSPFGKSATPRQWGVRFCFALGVPETRRPISRVRPQQMKMQNCHTYVGRFGEGMYSYA